MTKYSETFERSLKSANDLGKNPNIMVRGHSKDVAQQINNELVSIVFLVNFCKHDVEEDLHKDVKEAVERIKLLAEKMQG